MTTDLLNSGDQDSPPFLVKPPAVVPTGLWLAEQTRKQAVYGAKRRAWQMVLERRAEGTQRPIAIPCRCKKCGRLMSGGAQLRLPF